MRNLKIKKVKSKVKSNVDEKVNRIKFGEGMSEADRQKIKAQITAKENSRKLGGSSNVPRETLLMKISRKK